MFPVAGTPGEAAELQSGGPDEGSLFDGLCYLFVVTQTKTDIHLVEGEERRNDKALSVFNRVQSKLTGTYNSVDCQIKTDHYPI